MIGLLRRARPALRNITPDEGTALKELRNDDQLVILPADKGRATVVMDMCTYDEKMESLLSDRSTYKVITKDLSNSLQRRMNEKLLELKKKGALAIEEYNKLRCSSGRTPSIYGLPKIHKPDIPLRPIVSFYTSPTYALSKFLSRLLSPLVGNTSSYVRNSKDLVDFVRSVCLDSGEVMVSSDVVSLFTKIPVELALRVVRWYLESDGTLRDRTNLGIDEIVCLLSLCLNATYFSFRGVVYQQIFSTVMGSPVSVVVANLVMEDIEGRALDTFSSPVKCWK